MTIHKLRIRWIDSSSGHKSRDYLKIILFSFLFINLKITRMKNLLVILVMVSFVFSSSFGQKRIAFLTDPGNGPGSEQVGIIASLRHQN